MAQCEVVAFMGDGTNDGPTLHESDIGIFIGITAIEVSISFFLTSCSNSEDVFVHMFDPSTCHRLLKNKLM
ncbi:putative HAD superfamily protein [Helianthus anomalus]